MKGRHLHRGRGWPGAAICALVLCSASARGEPIAVAWDPDLAFDFDRAQYEQSLQQTLSDGYGAAASFLGLQRTGTLQVTVYTHEHYEKAFGPDAERRRGAHYSRGGIHVNGGNRLDGSFGGEMAHEMTHAVLDYRGTAHRLPAWFNEGLAERVAFRLRGLEGLAGAQVELLKRSVEHGEFAGLPPRQYLSQFQYLQAYAGVCFIEQKVGRAGLLRIARKTLQGETFEKALYAETHWSQLEFERALGSWIENLPT